MKIQDQVIALEQAKKLKELGIAQESFFNWVCVMPDPTGERYYFEVMGIFDKEETLTEIVASAFSVWELGLMLPRNFASFDCGMSLWRVANTFDYGGKPAKDKIGDYYNGNSKTYCDIMGNTEAQARAAMLIYLLENNHITPEEVNQRLTQ